jgi:dienelactone hydrolase
MDKVTTKGIARAALKLCCGLGLVILLSLCVLLVPNLLPVSLPAPSGAFAVGRTRAELSLGKGAPEKGDTSPAVVRRSDAPSKILLWIWYPAKPGTGSGVVPYLPQPWQTVRDSDPIQYLWRHQNSSVKANSLEAAELAIPQPSGVSPVVPRRGDSGRAHMAGASKNEKFPLLLMMPGFGASILDYQVFAEELASNGYVVVGIAAPDSEPVLLADDGRIYHTPLDAPSDQLLDSWAGEMIYVLNHLQDLPQTSLKFDRLDLQRIGAFGHSFGGAASIQASFLDHRIKAAADLDGKLWSKSLRLGTDAPCLIVHGKPFTPGRINGASVFNGKADKYLVTIPGSGHFNFLDNGMMFSPILKVVSINGLRPFGELDGKEILLLNRALLLSFFDRELKQLPAPFLESKHDQMQIEHFADGQKPASAPTF